METTPSIDDSAHVVETIDPSLWSTVVDHVERGETGVYWVLVDRQWRVTAASRSFQDEVLRPRVAATDDFFDCVAPGVADHLTRRVERNDLDGTNVEILHPIRTGTRAVLYTVRRTDDGWMLFGRDRSDQLELVSQMAVLIEDLDGEMQQERERARRLRSLLANDHLTGLANRRHLEEILEMRWEAFQTAGKSFAVIMIDVDEFKLFNDSYGHDVGDDVLKKVSAAIAGSAREDDTASRQGGDEFVVVACDSKLDDARKIGERIRTRVHMIPLSNAGGRISVSIGVAATHPVTPTSLQELLKWADMALLRAKDEGRNCVEAYTARVPDARAN